VEDGILMPQPLQLTRSSGGAVLICCQKHMLLHADPGNVLLKVLNGGVGLTADDGP
jgi:hypothetical protein